MHRHPSITVAGVFPKQLLEDVKIAFTEGLSEEEVSCKKELKFHPPKFKVSKNTGKRSTPISQNDTTVPATQKSDQFPHKWQLFLPDLNRIEVFGLPCGVHTSICTNSSLKKPQDGYD